MRVGSFGVVWVPPGFFSVVCVPVGSFGVACVSAWVLLCASEIPRCCLCAWAILSFCLCSVCVLLCCRCACRILRCSLCAAGVLRCSLCAGRVFWCPFRALASIAAKSRFEPHGMSSDRFKSVIRVRHQLAEASQAPPIPPPKPLYQPTVGFTGFIFRYIHVIYHMVIKFFRGFASCPFAMPPSILEASCMLAWEG